MKELLLAFVPVFVAVDAVGILPLFMSLTERLDKAQRQRVVNQSMVTALAVAVGFVGLGKAVFHVLGITVDDFKAAGGVLLFAIATMDLISGRKSARGTGGEIGAVPLGTPMIVGPAVLTTALILVDLYGYVPTLASIVVNIAIAGIILRTADFWTRILGVTGSRAVSKVASLILAAIAVKMVRSAIMGMIAQAT